MKLVSAKCPNCGSNLDVNPDNETMKCKYCKSAILIEDAIKKYNIEIFGEIEINNLPKIDNYLKNAERNYNSKNYDEAYKIYGKIIELDPNNTLSLLRYGICKTMLNNYIDFPLDYLIKSFNDVVEIEKNNNLYDKNIESYIDEVIDAVDESLYSTRKYYNTYAVNSSDLKEIQNKLISIVNCYEELLKHTIKNKEYIIKQLISVLNDILKEKNYKTGSSINGGNYFQTYQSSGKTKKYFVDKLYYYEKLNGNDQVLINNNNLNSKTKKNDYKKLITIILDILLSILTVGAFSSGNNASAIMMLIIIFLISFDKTTDYIFRDNMKLKKVFIVCSIILLIIAIINNR